MRKPSWTKPDDLLLLLVGTDLVIVCLHVLDWLSQAYGAPGSAFGRFSDPFFSLGQNRGFGEAFQYIKFIWIAMALGLLAVRERERLFAAWAALFTYLIVDDLFELHERVGLALGDRLSLFSGFGLRSQDVGELMVTGVACIMLLPWIGISHLAAGGVGKARSVRLFVLLAWLAFFGIAVDMVHVAARSLHFALLDASLVVVEDGGEMIVVSLMVWHLMDWLRGARPVVASQPER